MNNYVTKDSGQREGFSTGAVRDTRAGKGRYDLLSPHGIRRLAGLYERGALKYGEGNYERGMVFSRVLDSLLRHAFQYLGGCREEDHLAAVAWNAFALMHYEEEIAAGRLPAGLNDLRRSVAGEWPEEYDPVAEAAAEELRETLEEEALSPCELGRCYAPNCDVCRPGGDDEPPTAIDPGCPEGLAGCIVCDPGSQEVS